MPRLVDHTVDDRSNVVEIPGSVAGKKVTEVGAHAVDGALNTDSVELSVPDYTEVNAGITVPVNRRIMTEIVTVTGEGDTNELEAGKTLQLTAEAATNDPEIKPTNDKVSWSSLDEAVATVDGNGNVTAVRRARGNLSSSE